MKAYMSFLKILGILLLIPLFVTVIGFLVTLGFGLDFKNAWSNNSSVGSGSIYVLVLPFSFIAIVGWIISTLLRRRSALMGEALKTKARQEVYEELDIASDIHDVIVNMLIKHGGMTSEEISQKLKISQQDTLVIIKELLKAGRISQDITHTPARLYAKI